MKKRVLSATLAIAMLASSVGAMNVFAADNVDAYEGYNYKAYNVGTAIDDGTAEKVSIDGLKAASENVFNFDASGDIDVFVKGTYYLFDFADKSDTYSAATLEDLYNDAKAGDETNDWNAFVEAFAKYVNGDSSVATEISWEYSDYSASSDVRQDAISAFLAVKDDATDLNKENQKKLKAYYDDADIADYNLDELVKDVAGGTVTTLTTSELVYLTNEYNRLLGESGIVSPSTTDEEQYDEWMDKASNLVEDDYSAVNWRKVENAIALAEAQADDGSYGDAVSTLKAIFTDIETKTPDYSDLKDALADLFADGVIPRVTNIDETTTPADIAVFPDSGENYEKKDFDDDDDSLELWYEFAGNKDSAEDDEYYVGAYREALRVYSLCAKSSTRKFVAQSTVDNALEDLNTAIMNLDPDAETDNWLFVRLEDALDKANEVIEDDYRTTATAWKNFEKAKENVEKALENSNLTESAAERYAVALETAIKNLSSARKSVPTATKNELKDALKEAKDMQKDKDGKTASQINNLDEAIKAADKLNANTSLISEYETAIADLETAMTAYNQQQGWYKDGNTWYYGKEDTVAKGWLNVNGVWYLLDSTTGAMKTGWQQVNGTWYYLNASGAMQTGWLNLNGTYYYLESWGGMATGWKSVNGSWYYLQSSGAMVANGWYWINGKCYYFYNWGGMAANTTINGWTVGADGAWIQ